MEYPNLFKPLRIGDLELSHRIVMAPLTRLRSSQPGNIPGPINASYYGQRATPGGLLISEASQIAPIGQGYPASPGIHSSEQLAGWRLVTRAVHEEGGFFFIQLWHVGRISHTSFHPEDGLPVAPSAVRPAGETMTASWETVPFETPRPLDRAEIPQLIETYRQAAQHAMVAGADGVEIHGANGYLLDQFLQDRTNLRTDEYGGSIENRARLLLEVVDAASSVWGPGRVGVRLSPFGTFNDMGDSDPVRLFTYVIRQLSARGIGYLHLIEPRSSESSGGAPLDQSAPDAATLFRDSFQGALIGAGGFTGDLAEAAIAAGKADAVAFGRWFISNPDLVERLRQNAPLNPYDRSTFYGGDVRGYTDYPTLAELESMPVGA
ncbi:MAG: alkene reductase [Bryobacterales bacterium]|nr:alkene reductase [Bryobacterales bacterium]